jgi:hypothetical protein
MLDDGDEEGLMAYSILTSGDEDTPARSSRRRHSLRWILLASLAGGVVAVVVLIAKRERAPQAEAPRAHSVRSAVATMVETATLEIVADASEARIVLDGRAVGTAPRTLDDLLPGRHRVRVEAADRVPWESEVNLLPGETQRLKARLKAALPRLRVESDIPGAIVFLDKRYLGKTPLEVRDIARGSHRLDVSVEGYDAHSETIELDTGKRSVMVRFRQVRLDERIAVVHRHGFGSCEGLLVATVQGLRYESAHAEHSFSVPLDAIERFEVDYLKKNLHVRLRGGRKYNFTIRDESSDPLLVFHREVERVLGKLALQDASG